jgi:multiple sugar transport system permease protein
MVGAHSYLSQAARYVLLCVILVVMVFPLLWMFRVAVVEPGAGIGMEILGTSSWTLSNFADLFARANLGRALWNSILVGGAVTLGNLLLCFLVGYGLARYRGAVNRIVFGTVIGVLMIPVHIVIIPLYLLCLWAGLYDSYWALILPWLVNPVGIFLIKQYLESIPTAMEEAARVDGAGELRILFQVVMPMCRPALAVLAIQVFFTNWNSFLFPFILTSSESLRTLPVALALYQGHQAIDWQHLMAGSAVAVAPVLIVFLFMQRQIVSGITAGAIKQ